MSSAAFQHGHKQHSGQGPVSTSAELWQFDVVQHEDSAGVSEHAHCARTDATRCERDPTGPARRAERGRGVSEASTDPMEAVMALFAPGGQYEIGTEDVLGVELSVYKNRFRSMRDLIAIADTRPDVDWVVQGDRRLTFGEHNELVRKVMVALTDLGVERGDRVAILTANTIEWVVMWWACAGLGVAVRAAQRVVEGRGARLRAARLGRQGAVLRPEALGRSCATSSTRSTRSSTSS